MDTEQWAEHMVAQARREARLAIGTLRIDKAGVMRLVTYHEEVQRRLKNDVAWAHAQRRKAVKDIAYFRTQLDGERFIVQLEKDVNTYERLAALLRAAAKEARA